MNSRCYQLTFLLDQLLAKSGVKLYTLRENGQKKIKINIISYIKKKLILRLEVTILLVAPSTEEEMWQSL